MANWNDLQAKRNKKGDWVEEFGMRKTSIVHCNKLLANLSL